MAVSSDAVPRPESAPGAPATGRRDALLLPAAILMAGLALIIYARILHAPFVYDDALWTKAPSTQAGTLSQVAALLFAGVPRRVTHASFALNFYVGWLDPFGYHLVNVAIHAVNGLLLFILVRLLFGCLPVGHPWRRREEAVALVAVVIWLVHPVQTQAVTYVWQRATSLCATFYLATLVMYVKARASRGAMRWLQFAAAAGAAGLALATKENAGSLPAVLALIEATILYRPGLERRPRSRWRVWWIAVAAGAATLAVAADYLGPRFVPMMADDFARRGFTLGERLLTESRVVVYYASLLVYPHPARLTLDYDYPLSHGLLTPPTTALCLSLIVAVVGAALVCLRRAPLVAFPVLWYFALLAIESTVVPLDLAYEHRLYLASAMPIVCGVAAACSVAGVRRREALGVFAILAVLLATWSWQRNEVWRDPVRLWTDTARKSPNKARVQANLGKALLDAGDPQRALAAYRRAFALNPGSVEPLNAEATIYLDYLNDLETARDLLDRVLALRPGYLPAHKNRGVLQMRSGETQAAVRTFEAVLTQDPTDPVALYNLSAIHFNEHRYQTAAGLLERGVVVWPGHVGLRVLLARTYAASGDLVAAEHVLAPASRHAPEDPTVQSAVAELATRRRATSPGS
jgi:protein O-mannosyl-transferase